MEVQLGLRQVRAQAEGLTMHCTRQSFAAIAGQGTAHMGPVVPLHMDLMSCARSVGRQILTCLAYRPNVQWSVKGRTNYGHCM